MRETHPKIKKKSGWSQSKSKTKVKVYYCKRKKKYGHFQVECLNLKNKGEDDKSSFSLWLVLLEEKSDGLEIVFAISVLW